MNKVEILLNENNEAILYVNGYELTSLGKNKTAQELEVLKEDTLRKFGINQETKQEIITKDNDFMVDENADLQLVRATMRATMRQLTDPNIPMEEKRRNLGYYNTITSQAKIIVSACLAEISIEKVRPKQIDVIAKK